MSDLDLALTKALTNYRVDADMAYDEVLKGPATRAEYQVSLEKLASQYREEIKQAVDKYVIGVDEVIDYQLDADWCLIATSQRMGGIKPRDLKALRNAFRDTQRQALQRKPEAGDVS